ncbi:RES family NAD+ phosphorylase [Acinetobacter indicus]|uniref:RES family NAD+ phosphorylase n=1 Tax=Acinetobacter TaxID=469 RepID=UPI0015D2EAC8|nr:MULTISPECIES: RES family NAD+ phosphorylase [Acinetobacter]MCP0917699.1 RES family NAD+ phosphorylase [Acinetobacter indicus]
MTKIQDSIWNTCRGQSFITPLAGTLFRLVESQEQIATWQLVDSLDEQAELEIMLEEVKPLLPDESEELHYLLKTPFRYPPLPWGSRFGSTDEPSIFYGGCSVEATLVESAYYRFVYWYSIDSTPIKKSIQTEHTMFTVGYQTFQGVKLQDPPFNEYLELIAHPTNYVDTQRLGKDMRIGTVEVFEYPSARAADHAICVGIFKTRNFTQNRPLKQVRWFCDLTADTVMFKSLEDDHILSYSLNDFLQHGEFPMPA